MKISILSNSCQRSEDFIDNVEVLKKGLEAVDFTVSCFFSNDILLHHELLAPYIIFLDKDLFLGKCLSAKGYTLFNNIDAIAVCDDKALTDMALATHDIPQLKTIYGPLIYPGNKFNDQTLIDEVIKRLGLPLIIKECHGSFGKQVYLANSAEEIIKIINSLDGRRFIFQEKAVNDNVDYRLQVVGDEVVATIRRQAPEGSFITNLTSGGVGTLVQPSEQMKTLALKTSHLLGLDFAGVDLIYHNDKLHVLEVNSNARIGKISRIGNIDLASKIAQYLKNKILQNK